MAKITLAGWMCSVNGCDNPIDSPLNQNYTRLKKKLPLVWIEAQKAMRMLSLNIRQTDVSKGQVSITHILKHIGKDKEMNVNTLQALQILGKPDK